MAADVIVQIWRCSKCGKWSHAKKQPKKHQVGYVHADTDYGPDIRYKDCGPFTPYVASPGRYRR